MEFLVFICNIKSATLKVIVKLKKLLKFSFNDPTENKVIILHRLINIFRISLKT